MNKLDRIFVFVFLMFSVLGIAQEKVEREHRILKSQFPPIVYHKAALGDHVKKMRYYKEVATEQVVYSTKFKKDRLHYQMFYTEEGTLKSVAFAIKQIDVPDTVYALFETYFNGTFDSWKLVEMDQLYPVASKDLETETFSNAFQNLMLSSILYKLVVKGKQDAQKVHQEFWFTAEGKFVSSRDMLPANHDRVLY